jgi:hypothetical protein
MQLSVAVKIGLSDAEGSRERSKNQIERRRSKQMAAEVKMVVSSQSSTLCIADSVSSSPHYTFTVKYDKPACTGYLVDDVGSSRSGTVALAGAYSDAVESLGNGGNFTLAWTGTPVMTGIAVTVP